MPQTHDDHAWTSTTAPASAQQAVEALRESEERLRLALEAARVVAWEVNPVKGTHHESGPVDELFGRTKDFRHSGVEGLASNIHAEDAPRVVAMLQAAARGECHYDVEFRVPQPDGGVRWLAANGALLRDAEGRPARLLGIARDITDRKQVEEALRASKADLDLALRSAQMGAWHWDLIKNLRCFDDQVCHLLGINPEQFTGTAEEFFNAVHPDDRQPLKIALSRAIEEGQPYEPEYRAVWPDGSIHHMVAKGTVVRDDSGRPVRLNGIILDITDRKEAEEALQRKTAFLEAQVNSSLDGILVVDQNQRRLLINRRLIELWSIPPHILDDVDDAALLTYVVGMTEHPEKFLERVTHLYDHPYETSRDEIEFKGGMVLDRYSAPVLGRDGQHYGRIWTFRDVTEPKRSERILLETNAQLEEATACAHQMAVRAEAANCAKSEFLANMSHEIRTPMTAILGYADMVAEGCPGQCAYGSRELREGLGTVRRNGKHLLSLINDILDLSKIEADKMTTELVACSPRRLVVEVASLVRGRATRKGLQFRTEFIGPVPATIRTDPQRLRQILINLLGNAIKFTQTGAVRLVVRLVTGGGVPQMQFDVIDTGVGMTAEQAKRMFQPFSQADSSTTRQYGGTGLGLVISRRLAHLIGGDVLLVESRPGQGTRFRATVATGSLDGVSMVEDGLNDATTDDSPEPAAQSPTPAALAKPLEGLRILLVEDGPDNQRLIELLLTKAGASVELADNGRIGLDKALAAARVGLAFDAILMDMQMPVMDGYEATQALRAAEYRGPIIALTAHAMEHDRLRCLNVGCDDFASKPIHRDRLIELVQRHARGAAAG